jgi:gliding motility-associated-like protein
VLLTDTLPPGVMVTSTVPGLLNATPQLTKPAGTYLYDTIGWQNRCWFYTAAGGEQAMTIGSFQANADVDVLQVVSQQDSFYRFRSYYHIDDVSLVAYKPSLFDTQLPEKLAICSGMEPVTAVTAGVFQSFQWSTGETTPSISISEPGIYVVTATHGCVTRIDTVEVVEHTTEVLPPDTMVCVFEPFDLILTVGADTYQWSTGVVSDTLTVSLPGTYTVTITGICDDVVDQMSILEAPQMSLVMPADTVIELGQQIMAQTQLFYPSGLTWQWWPTTGLSCSDCPQPMAQPLVSTNYNLTVTNAFGCTVSSMWHIEVVNKKRVYVPNIFSPDFDGFNDVLQVFTGTEVKQIEQFDVFDRWGNQVFHAAPLLPGLDWDATFRGMPVPGGQYVYVLDVLYLDGTRERIGGDVLVQY